MWGLHRCFSAEIPCRPTAVPRWTRAAAPILLQGFLDRKGCSAFSLCRTKVPAAPSSADVAAAGAHGNSHLAAGPAAREQPSKSIPGTAVERDCAKERGCRAGMCPRCLAQGGKSLLHLVPVWQSWQSLCSPPAQCRAVSAPCPTHTSVCCNPAPNDGRQLGVAAFPALPMGRMGPSCPSLCPGGRSVCRVCSTALRFQSEAPNYKGCSTL